MFLCKLQAVTVDDLHRLVRGAWSSSNYVLDVVVVWTLGHSHTATLHIAYAQISVWKGPQNHMIAFLLPRTEGHWICVATGNRDNGMWDTKGKF